MEVINLKKVIIPGLIAGALMLISAVILNVVMDSLFPEISKQYRQGGFFRPWSDPLMSLIFIQPVILGITMAFVWENVTEKLTPPLRFGLIYWAIVTLPGMLISYSTFNISLLMILSWTFTGLIQILLGSFVISKMNKSKGR